MNGCRRWTLESSTSAPILPPARRLTSTSGPARRRRPCTTRRTVLLDPRGARRPSASSRTRARRLIGRAATGHERHDPELQRLADRPCQRRPPQRSVAPRRLRTREHVSEGGRDAPERRHSPTYGACSRTLQPASGVALSAGGARCRGGRRARPGSVSTSGAPLRRTDRACEKPATLTAARTSQSPSGSGAPAAALARVISARVVSTAREPTTATCVSPASRYSLPSRSECRKSCTRPARTSSVTSSSAPPSASRSGAGGRQATRSPSRTSSRPPSVAVTPSTTRCPSPRTRARTAARSPPSSSASCWSAS